MKYKEIVKIIKNISLALPDVQSFYTGDVYEVNADQSVKYSSVVLTNQEHQFDNINDKFQYNFILFYIDRLTDDEANRTDVHTAAVSALKAIVQRLEDYNVIINDFKFNLFRERFNDQCAGAYASLSVEVEDNDCTEDFSFDFGQISPDKLKEISITTNGTYTPSDGYYYTKVSVNVQPPLQSKTLEITENGTSRIEADSEHYGLKAVDVNVNVPTPTFSTEELNVTANGTYTPSTDGYSKVNVAVPIPTFETEELNATSNGTYTPSTDGFSKVNVNVEPNLQSKTLEITENGTQTISADNGYDGLSSVSVTTNISGGTTSDKIMLTDGTKFAYSKAFDASLYDTSQVTDFGYMFNNCDALTSLDLSNFNTSNVTRMEYMFYQCKHLTSLDLSNFDTSNVTRMDDMFNDCQALASLDLSNFNISSVTNTNTMFYHCINLTSLDLSNFNTSSVTRMEGMFGYCQALSSLDLSNFNTSKVTNMNVVFNSCTNLTSLNLSGWNMNNVTDMISTFRNCSALTDLNMNGAILPKMNLTRWYLDSCPLTVDSLVSVLNALPQLSSSESFICTIGSTNLAKLSSEQIAIATEKGWVLN